MIACPTCDAVRTASAAFRRLGEQAPAALEVVVVDRGGLTTRALVLASARKHFIEVRHEPAHQDRAIALLRAAMLDAERAEGISQERLRDHDRHHHPRPGD